MPDGAIAMPTTGLSSISRETPSISRTNVTEIGRIRSRLFVRHCPGQEACQTFAPQASQRQLHARNRSMLADKIKDKAHGSCRVLAAAILAQTQPVSHRRSILAAEPLSVFLARGGLSADVISSHNSPPMEPRGVRLPPRYISRDRRHDSAN